MATLVLTAENFAFGPIGRLLVVADLLKQKKHKLIFAGFGTSLQLARKFPFDEIHEIDTDDPSSQKNLEKIVEKSDMLISCMDIPSITTAKKLNKLTVWIDPLFWFWDDLPKEVLEVDLFIKEKSLKDNKNDSKLATKIKNLCTVGPIMNDIKNDKRKKQVIISYGGGEASYSYRIGQDTNFPYVMTKIILDHVNLTEFNRVIVATNENTIKNLKEKFPKAPFEFVCLPYDIFIRELSQSELILITPGLVTSEYAFSLGTPTIFLPASNNSQYLQLEEFRDLGIAPASVSMSDFLDKLDLKTVPILKSTQLVLNQLRELERSMSLQVEVGKALNKLVKSRKTWSTEFITNGKKFIDTLGGNGAKTAEQKIVQLLIDNNFM